jgi:pimeloyl-ACP methyl ester carboxylesterase
VRKVAYDMSLSPANVAVPAMRAGLSYDFAGPLKELEVPIVAINSDLGEPLNELRVKKVLPKFRAVTLSGLGHFLMMEDPTRFNTALETEVHAMVTPAGS